MGSNTNQNQAVNSPFFLHAGENPALVLVQPPMNGQNYSSWSRSMKVALTSKNKIKFVDGTVVPPAANHADYEAWLQCNSMVISWIMNSLSPTVAKGVIWIDSCKQLWDDLKRRFSTSDSYKVSDISEEIHTLKQGDLSVTEYFTNLRSLWDELGQIRPIPPCDCGSMAIIRKYLEDDCVITFLKGLNNSFSNTKSQILMISPLPDVETVFSIMIKQERQLLHEQSSVLFDTKSGSDMPTQEASVNLASHGSYQNSYQRGQNSYRRGNSSTNNSNFQHSARRPYCTNCNKPGHYVDKCYHIHGFPPGFRGRGRASVNMVFDEQAPGSGNRDAAPVLSDDQLQQIIQLLRPEINNIMSSENHNNATVLSARVDEGSSRIDPNSSRNAGSYLHEEDWIS